MMEAENITAALAELQNRGWPCSHYHTDKDSSAWELTNVEDGTCHICIFHYGDGAPAWVDRSVLLGFLVAQLEARGLRREVAWSYRPGLTRNSPQVWRCRVTTINRYGNYLFGEWLETEFAALIECCLALPALPDAQQTQEVADDRQ